MAKRKRTEEASGLGDYCPDCCCDGDSDNIASRKPIIVPSLFFPAHENKVKKTSCHFLNLEANSTLLKYKNMDRSYSESCCIGSSHGWLVYLDEFAAPFLLNPFTDARIQLPSVCNLLNILSIDKYGDEFEVRCKLRKDCRSYNWCTPFVITKQLRESFIHKAILSTCPLFGYPNNTCQVALICGFESKLASWKSGEESWSELPGKHAPYQDIMFNENKLYALGDGGFLEVWDFNHDGAPLKTMEIKPCLEELTMKKQDFSKELYTTRAYLVQSCGDVLMVLRHIGEFVNEAGQAVLEADILGDDNNTPHPLVCPYKTIHFCAYKLNLGKNSWVETETLGNQTVFVGGNHSIAISDGGLSRIEEDSIYFTDDYWSRMNEDCLYGGHDMGIFSFRDQTIKPFYQTNSNRIHPPPSWVLPDM